MNISNLNILNLTLNLNALNISNLGFFLRSNVYLGNSGHTANMHTHLEARYRRICLGARYMACESRLWSHTSSSLGWSIRRASGLGSCGRDGRAYLIDPPQFLATSELLRRYVDYASSNHGGWLQSTAQQAMDQP